MHSSQVNHARIPESRRWVQLFSPLKMNEDTGDKETKSLGWASSMEREESLELEPSL